ncbi:MAG: c-type cytochrome biogenesis protein CcmI [Reyranellales bacterium]
MLEFLLALLTTATVAALLIPLLRARPQSPDGKIERLDHDLAIYRDQLAQIDREHAAGALPETEAAAARIEVERRILAAAERTESKAAPESSALQRFLPPALALLIPLFALGIYLEIGRPGLSAAPFQARVAPAAPQRQPTLAEVLAEARARVAQKPDDPEALSVLGEALTAEADGTVTQPAVEAFNKALAAQPNDARALYYLGLHEVQSGDSKAALERWRSLEARSAPDAPYLPMLRAEIQRVAKEAGLPMPNGPSKEAVEAMAKATPEQRQAAIRGMVEGLDAKLRADGSDRAGWLRLAQARKVLGENDKAVEAYARADALGPLETRLLADWAEAHVRLIGPGAAPSPQAVAVLERLEKAEPRNALALFYLGAASFASGDKAAALRRWKTLLALLPADAPIRGLLEERIKQAE